MRKRAKSNLVVTVRSAGVWSSPGASNTPLQSRGPTFSLPVDYAQLLGLSGREVWLNSQIVSAYNEMAGAAMEPGYSDRVAEGRAALLHEAKSALLAAKGRQLPGQKELYVTWDAVPGALCLMCELGEHEAVLELGAKVLKTWESRQLRRDIVLSMALANCGLAAEALRRNAPALAGARLQEAANQLANAGPPALAPQLQANVRAALADLQPACVLDQLKLPLTVDYQEVRQQAFAPLRSLLLDQPREEAVAVDAQFVLNALERLTAEEAATLLDWHTLQATPQRHSWLTMAVERRAVLALVTAGFVGRKPKLIRNAQQILLRLYEEYDVVAELAVVQVLLGTYESADALLRHGGGWEAGGGGGPSAARADALDFVRGASPEIDSDLLPGLVVFSQTWLQRVAFPAFRDTTASPPTSSLTPYFDDPRVTSWLAANGEGGSASPLDAAKAWGRELGSSLAALVPYDQKSGPLVRLRQHLPAAKRQQLIAGGVAVLLALSGFFAISRLRSSTVLPGTASGEAAAGTQAKQRVPRTWWGGRSTTSISRRGALRTIQRWQDAKAAALGPRYNRGLLHEALAEPMLTTVLQQSATAEANGWFWTYDLQNVQVEGIRPGPPSEEGYNEATAIVTAKLQESAELWGKHGKKADSYASTYRVEYILVQRPDGSWRIFKALVLGR